MIRANNIWRSVSISWWSTCQTLASSGDICKWKQTIYNISSISELSLVDRLHYTCLYSPWIRFCSSNKRKHDGKNEENASAVNVRFKNSLHLAMACGDYEKLQQGVFENYLNIKFKDAKMQNVLGKDFIFSHKILLVRNWLNQAIGIWEFFTYWVLSLTTKIEINISYQI